MGKNIIITGATGMIGGIALQLCLESPDVDKVTTLGRKPTGVQHPKLHEVVHEDFLDFTNVMDAFEAQDAALFCLGAYTGAVPDDLFKVITVDYTLEFARSLKEKSPDATFCLLSGNGADRTEKSKVSFARYKGMAENGLARLGFPRLHLFHPNYIYPVTPRKEPNLSYTIYRAIWPVLRKIGPNLGVDSDVLARAMVKAALYGTGEMDGPVMENRDIRSFGKA